MTVCAVATADACWAADLSALETLSDLIQDAHERFTPGINICHCDPIHCYFSIIEILLWFL